MNDTDLSVLKTLLFATVAAGTALWGWTGWLVVLWVVLMVLDYATGTLAAMRAGNWSSETARDGLWHKGGMILLVALSALTDVFIRLMLTLNAITIHYKTLVCPVVLAWYCVTELGSAVENAAALGAPVPAVLRKALKAAHDAAGEDGENGEEGKKE